MSGMTNLREGSVASEINDLVAAELSQAAYGDVAPPAGWTAIGPPDVVGLSSFTIYSNSNDQLVFAFRGTDSSKQLVGSITDQGGGDWETIKATFDAGLKKIQSDPAYASYTIFTDGHSLGGGMAQTAAVEYSLSGYAQNSLPISSQAISEDDAFQTSGGLIAALMAWASSSHIFRETTVDADITTIFYHGDLNLYSTPITSSETVENVIGNPYAAAELYTSLKILTSRSVVGKTVGVALLGLEEFMAHRISNVVDTLKQSALPTGDSSAVSSHAGIDSSTAIVAMQQDNIASDETGPLVSTETDGTQVTLSLQSATADSDTYAIGVDGVVNQVVSVTSDTATQIMIDTKIQSGATVEYTNDSTEAGVSQSVTFTGPGETLQIDDPKNFDAVVGGFQLGDTLDLSGVVGTAASIGSNDILSVALSDGSELNIDVSLEASSATGFFGVRPDGIGGTDVYSNSLIAVSGPTVEIIDPSTGGIWSKASLAALQNENLISRVALGDNLYCLGYGSSGYTLFTININSDQIRAEVSTQFSHTLYADNVTGSLIGLDQGHVVSVNPDTGLENPLGSFTPSSILLGSESAGDGSFYLMEQASPSFELYTIDVTSGAVVSSVAAPAGTFVVDDRSGKLVGISGGQIVSLDPGTGSVSVIAQQVSGVTGVALGTLNAQNGILYFVGVGQGTRLYSVDIDTGQMLGSVASNTGFTADQVDLATAPWSTSGLSVAVVAAQINALYQAVLGRSADDGGMTTWQASLSQPGGSLAGVRIALASSAEAASDINTLYQALLGRPADAGGMAAWQASLSQPGGSLTEVRLGLAGSAEATSDISSLYQTELDRPADTGGLASWQADLRQPEGSLTDVRHGLADSAEATSDINALYQAELGRHADAGGVSAWQASLGQLGGSLNGVRAGLADSAEAAADINTLYQAELGRPSDAGGLAAWQAALRQPTGSLTEVRQDLANSAEAGSDINTLYEAELGRPADAIGKAVWIASLSQANGSLAAVRTNIADSAESQARVISQFKQDNPGVAPSASQITAAQLQMASGLSFADLNVQTLRLATFTNTVVGSAASVAATSRVDIFALSPSSFGQTVVTGFDPNFDIVQVNSALYPDLAAIRSAELPSSSGVQVPLGAGHYMLLQGVSAASLIPADYRFT